MQEENKLLREEIQELKNESYLEKELVYHQGVYVKSSTNDVYCGVCWDRDKKLSRVWKKGKGPQGQITFSCDVCKTWRASDIPFEV